MCAIQGACTRARNPTRVLVLVYHERVVATTKGLSSLGQASRGVPLLLVVYADPRAPLIVPLVDKSYFTLGRDPSCDIVVPHDSVSRTHATLHASPLAVLDGGSRNGTHIGRRAIAPKTLVPLDTGDTFRIGSVTCRIVEGVTSVDAPPPSVSRTSLSPAMRALDKRVTTVAKSALRVLVLGETGVGKDVVVGRIHERSARSNKPLLALNCAALPETILDGELFGHEKGAFTGATEAKAGLFESADGGTIFLDEIAELPLGTQAKLLRTLENSEVLRLGARRATKIDVRVIAATHGNLDAMVAAKTFRQDLFYRLNGVSVFIPPLRERHDEIVPLAETFLRASNTAQRFSKAAITAMLAHPWPGNIRELRNAVERASVLAESDTVDAADLALAPAGAQGTASARLTNAPRADTALASPDERPSLPDELRALEKSRIEEALEACGGNRTRAAERLGMSRFALRKRIDDFGLDKRGDERE